MASLITAIWGARLKQGPDQDLVHNFTFLLLPGESIHWIPVVFFVIIFAVVGALFAYGIAKQDKKQNAWAMFIFGGIYSLIFLMIFSALLPFLIFLAF